MQHVVIHDQFCNDRRSKFFCLCFAYLQILMNAPVLKRMNATSMPCVPIIEAPISVNAPRVSRAMGEIAQVIAPRKMALTDFAVRCRALGSFGRERQRQRHKSMT